MTFYLLRSGLSLLILGLNFQNIVLNRIFTHFLFFRELKYYLSIYKRAKFDKKVSFFFKNFHFSFFAC
jgi:hypothetical protein